MLTMLWLFLITNDIILLPEGGLGVAIFGGGLIFYMNLDVMIVQALTNGAGEN